MIQLVLESGGGLCAFISEHDSVSVTPIGFSQFVPSNHIINLIYRHDCDYSRAPLLKRSECQVDDAASEATCKIGISAVGAVSHERGPTTSSSNLNWFASIHLPIKFYVTAAGGHVDAQTSLASV